MIRTTANGHADYPHEPGTLYDCPMCEAEMLCREFADVHDAPNVRRAVALCESGRLSWVQVAELFAKSYAAAKREVK